MAQRVPNPLFLAAAMAVTLLAAAVRLSYLGYDSLWFDEILTRHAAVQGPFAAGALGGRDHLPLLYMLAGAALRLLPEHEFTLRLPSAIAGMLAVPLLIAFGRAARLSHAGLWAALLLALLPFHIRYSQEARHYALLLFFSLLSLYWLYRALAGNERRAWLFFGLATALNLLTHYSAWLLLAAQGVLILGWAAWLARREGLRSLATTVPGLLVISVTLLALALRALTALRANAGPAGQVGTTGSASLVIWLRESWLAFGFEAALPAWLLALAALLGLALLLFQRRWLLAALLVVPALVPVLLIELLQVARWALPKYIIFILPLYLFCSGVTLQAVVDGLTGLLPAARGSRAAGVLSVALALLLVALAWPGVQQERARLVRDWRGAVADLEAELGPDDLLVAVALDTADGYNAGGIAAAYYLDPGRRLLDGNHVDLARAQALAGQTGRVAAIALSAHRPLRAETAGWQITPYAHGLYTVLPPASGADSLAQLAALYAFLSAQADAPSPQCALVGKQALFHLARGDETAAQAALEAVDPGCPLDAGERQEAQALLDRRRLEAALAAGDHALADQLAAQQLALDPRDERALAVLTTADLLALFTAGEAQVMDNQAPEQVDRRRFEMPQSGDAGEVLFMHPPSAARFLLHLPDEPLTLRTRLALDPQSWGWGGDGVTFVVQVQREGGPTRELLRRHLANTGADQRWHEVAIPLDEYAGQEVSIILAVENGPAGDGTGDWAGWERPRVMRWPLVE